MEKVSKIKVGDEIFEVTNPFVEYGKRAGIEIGVDRGRAEGREEGIVQRNIEIASEMLAKDYTDEQISEITGLSQKQIDQLKQSKRGYKKMKKLQAKP